MGIYPNAHRKQLKKILNIKHSKKIMIKSLFRIYQEKQMPIQILSARWSLFGHILRRDKDIFANKATRAYFIPNGNKLLERPKKTFMIFLMILYTLLIPFGKFVFVTQRNFANSVQQTSRTDSTPNQITPHTCSMIPRAHRPR